MQREDCRGGFQKKKRSRGNLQPWHGGSEPILFHQFSIKYISIFKANVRDFYFIRLLIISPRSLNNFWNFPRCANRCCTVHATTSAERENDRLITVHAPFLAMAPNQNAVRPLYDGCTLWGRLLQIVWIWFFFLQKKRKRNRVVEFAKMLIYVWDSAWTLISRSFPPSVGIVSWLVQQRFAYRGKFQKLFNDRGKIISNLGYSTSFNRNQFIV